LLAVVAAQGVVLGLAAMLGILGLLATADAERVVPFVLRLPLEAAGEISTPPEGVRRDLGRRMPGVHVELAGDAVVLTGARERVLSRVPFAVLRQHGYQADRFTMGRDLDLPRIVRRLASSGPVAIGWMLLALPIGCAVAGVVLRRRTVGAWEGARGRWVAAAAGVAAGLVGAFTVEAAVRLLGADVPEQPVVEAVLAAGAVPTALLALVAVVFAPFGEELFFRGWMLRYLDARMGSMVAYGASSVLFALAHLHPAGFGVYLVLGLALAGLYAWSRSLWAPVLAHATINAVAVAGWFGWL
jgi:hypothetical protein